jgi:predicted acylesterase/phospholipase RssA
MDTAQTSAAGDYRYCDLVMKGGITSGVIYPTTAVELAKQYRFKNIGGTSAGAIAAAVTAAAELGRRRNHEAAFSTLAALPDQLARNGQLLALFTPDLCTRKAFKLLRGFTAKRSVAGKIVHTLLGIALSAWPWFTLGLVIGVIIPSLLYAFVRWHSLLSVMGLFDRHPLVCLASGLAVGLPFGLAVAAVQAGKAAVQSIAANGFGLCSGLASQKSPSESLTGWIHGRIQAAAGKSNNRPVTFGDLWKAPLYPEEKLVTARTINFEIVTTGVTEGRPFTIPFRGAGLYFDPVELGRTFPEDVMKALLNSNEEAEDLADAARDNRPVVSPSNVVLRRLPKNEDLPIVVATRMSLSFPGLISAVPLYRVDYSLDRNQRGNTQYVTRVGTRVWFSDGGICSNFPLNFFDSPLPRWPTFGINLQQAGETLCKTDRNVASNFVRPPKATGSAPVIWNSIGDARWTTAGTMEQRDPAQCVLKFFGAIVNTMQNWRDNLQASAPGFRDRVVSVSLCPDEGGLNLAMPETLIRDLSTRGSQAALLLLNDFDFGQHLFTRFRIAMCAIQDLMHSLQESSAWRSAQDAPGWAYIDAQQVPIHYKWGNKNIAEQAPEALRALLELLNSWASSLHEKEGFCTGVPRPKSTLRAVPDF